MKSRITLLAVVLGALALASCFHTHEPQDPGSSAPRPDSPQHAVQRLAWCWVNRDVDAYGKDFTDDFRFVAAASDSAGSPYRQQPWLLEDEMVCAQHLFVGGGALPPASSITLAMGSGQIALPDPRPGMNFRVHCVIRASVDLRVSVTDAQGTLTVSPVSGRALFFLVRGDSAQIPPNLLAQGYRPDSTRWWIERWEDETVGAVLAAAPTAGRLAALPTRYISWFALKAAYRQ